MEPDDRETLVRISFRQLRSTSFNIIIYIQYMYVSLYMIICVYTYIYIYMYRERERKIYIYIYIYTYIYIYIYIYTYVEKERERERLATAFVVEALGRPGDTARSIWVVLWQTRDRGSRLTSARRGSHCRP